VSLGGRGGALWAIEAQCLMPGGWARAGALRSLVGAARGLTAFERVRRESFGLLRGGDELSEGFRIMTAEFWSKSMDLKK